MNQTTNDTTRALYLNMKSHGTIQRTDELSSFQSWIKYQREETVVVELLLIGLGVIVGQGAIIFKLWLMGDI